LITTEILLEKARQIYPQIPQYINQPAPEFSVGWAQKFRQRHGIKRRVRHGEAGSIPEEAAIEMEAVVTLCRQYQDDDIYNMDETGLFWRQAPSSGLSTTEGPGVKKDKSRISLVVCSNASGTDKVPLWVIGHAKSPRAFRNINIQAMAVVWRYNTKAWMNGVIMKEWLDVFYRRIGQRSVLLLMDNFSGHTTGLELSPPPINVKVQMLPKNATSVYQPLDQGIIQNLKVYYKKQWLRFIVDELDSDRNPYRAITLLHTLRWLTQAWNHDVQRHTIYACFQKSTVLPRPQLQLPLEVPDITPLFDIV